jgi:hypothetical protein
MNTGVDGSGARKIEGASPALRLVLAAALLEVERDLQAAQARLRTEEASDRARRDYARSLVTYRRLQEALPFLAARLGA